MSYSDSGILVVLEERDPERVNIQASFSRRLVAALREQTFAGAGEQSLTRRSNRWIAAFGPQNRSLTLALVILLVISSLAFGLGSALQIDQAERPGISFSERIGGLFGARGAADPAAGQGSAPTPPNTLATYGAGFSWPDRFSSIEVQREIASSKVLWPLSTFISMIVLAAWLLPRSNRRQQKSSAD